MSTSCKRCHLCEKELLNYAIEFCCQKCERLCCGLCPRSHTVYSEKEEERCERLCKPCRGADSEGKRYDLPSSLATDTTRVENLASRDENSVAQSLDFVNTESLWDLPVLNRQVDYFSEEEEDEEYSANEFSHARLHPIKAMAKDQLRSVVAGLLVSDNREWLDIITSLAWKAAKYIKPDTSYRSMDPRTYVKVKCINSGNLNQSCFIKGIVCSKNISNKKKNVEQQTTKLMILAESVKHKTVACQLSFFKDLLPQEQACVRMIKERLASLRPDILLVEKSVTSYV
ncbi:PREDICTED: putative 1-phosphatidylinositol-3-phosphate 5-kinase FAB1C [Camelina sativa]|uniref:1-phosphatidylinositol-3-phosphate 5-kinase FAB1C n=1 Tax=Camelina sativa TaxID=90675 RepID=A0ABM0YC58_CAMSA|nr:PREDICTED: putative 1-phosphatidylinositol-3-phosphate 5-kinase FAB1C [Camelina sativa]XP_010498802.1 PREDICTED: putative 1-phosphatidylinositol-3-phosphate 5-kinase FAB1C [Camelina sativa]XP_010498805.1 PREDICTED: putative 1-phosphatidylinositol-3-phosphate 5-kinase FAB1C [Camelina sativa]